MKHFEITYIGAGPATMFSVLKLLKKGYRKDILIIEKGKSLKDRKPTELLAGSFGLGCYSDSKITLGMEVGGNIPNIDEKKLNEYGDELLKYLNEFKCQEDSILKWDVTTLFDTAPSDLKWDVHKTCHVGTDRGREIYLNIEKYIDSFPNVKFLFETELEEAVDLLTKFQLVLRYNNNMTAVLTNKLVIATGQKSLTSDNIMRNFNLHSIPRALQLGVRVEDIMNSQYEDIIKANYDFKFVKNYSYANGVNVRVRTFCCNSGNAHTCAENTKEGFTCFNGHAYKAPDPTNHTVNYGIICEVTGLDKYSTKEEQISLMKKVNNLSSWKNDNLDDNGKPHPIKKLLDGFNHLRGLYPDEVLDSMEQFSQELNQIVNLENAHYLYPEIKLSGSTPILNKYFETEKNNLYMIGDCALSRGILKSALMGIILAEHIK